MDYEGSQPEQMVQASLQNVTLTLPVTGAEQIAPLSTTTPTFDSAGRITSIRTEGQDGSEVGASLGYDPFGAVAREQGADLHFTDSSNSATLHRARHGYDAADSRLFARITQYETGSTPHDNDRSWLYGYDALNRLTSASLGALDATNTAITTTNPRLIQWNLDTLGNWNGGDIQTGGGLAGKTVSYDTSIPPNGTYDDPTTYTHATDTRNELDSLTVQTPSGPTTATFYYDLNGNLVNDGPDGFFYQYDAHNRLVQVNKRGSLQFNADGTILSGDPGAWVAHYTYDGVGRLIRKQVPWNYIRTALRAEAYYYDGVRRIQEVFTDPKPGTFPEKVHQGDPPPNPVYITATRAEFIWAPGGGAPGYVDELVCQITPLNAPQYVLQDANYNAVALVDLAGTVLSQFTYDPYGEPIIAEQGINGTASQVMDLRVGHQGLFLDRLNLLGNGALDESGASGSNWTMAAPTGGLGNRALYQNRNRTYSPSLGRFIQRDPLRTGLSVLGANRLPCFGENTRPAALYGSADSLSNRCTTLHVYAESNPLNGRDPTGLFLLPDTARNALDYVSRAQKSYELGSHVLKFAKNVAAGASVQSAMLAMAAEIAADKAGGKLFDKLLSGAAAVGRGAAKLGTGIRHHVLPRFLGGSSSFSKKIVTRIGKDAHDDFHRMLEREFRESGLPGPSTMKGEDYQRYLEIGDNGMMAFDALMKACSKWDAKYSHSGISLVGDLIEQMTKQRGSFGYR